MYLKLLYSRASYLTSDESYPTNQTELHRLLTKKCGSTPNNCNIHHIHSGNALDQLCKFKACCNIYTGTGIFAKQNGFYLAPNWMWEDIDETEESTVPRICDDPVVLTYKIFVTLKY